MEWSSFQSFQRKMKQFITFHSFEISKFRNIHEFIGKDW